jgi:hypothetical protein
MAVADKNVKGFGEHEISTVPKVVRDSVRMS